MSDFQTQHSVQAVGGVVISYIHPLIDSGDVITFQGFKLQSQFLDGESAVDNSVIIPILGGGSIQLTNNNLSGTITFNCTRVSTKVTDGDIVTVAQAQMRLGDSTGATIAVSWPFNGFTFKVTFYKCTVKKVPPLKLAGNDAPDYGVQFNYGYYETDDGSGVTP
jgi:hypothetical protein